MNRSVVFLLGLALIAGCAGPPIIYTPEIKPQAIQKACDNLFPTSAYQLIHSLELSLTGRKKSVLVGVTDIYPRSGKIRSVIMTVEGLVLFEAEKNKTLVVHRAMPPFNAPAFAKGLMSDIGLIFFNFPDNLTDAGRLETGEAICRNHSPEGHTIDTIIYANGAWERKKYDEYKQLTRYVRPIPAIKPSGVFPKVLELTAHGNSRYRLKLTLVRSEVL